MTSSVPSTMLPPAVEITDTSDKRSTDNNNILNNNETYNKVNTRRSSDHDCVRRYAEIGSWKKSR